MLDNVTRFDPSAAVRTITEILTPSEEGRRSPVVPLEETCRVITLHSSNYDSLSLFRASYGQLKRPALLFVTAEQLREVQEWIRDSDDIAVVGDADEVVKWRLERIARSFVKQLDPLTKVYQRDHLIDALIELCPKASAANPVSLVLLDIDHLKALNDRYGPVEGNHVLKCLGALIQSLCQTTLVARTRGGEFAVLVEHEESIAERVAEILVQAINQAQWCKYDEVTASVGVASVVTSCEPAFLLTRADEALFSAKANGRNRVVRYHEIPQVSNRSGEEVEVISLENKARVMSERVTSFVTQKSKMIMKNLQREANTDSLTGLFNRRYLDRKLAEDFENAIRNNKDLSIALLDVDHFGEVNKQHGWPTGDKVLREVASLIQQSIRGSDWVGRYGGEELCIVMLGTRLENAVQVCERIRQAIDNATFRNSDNVPFGITLSAGVVEMDPAIHCDPEQLMECVSKKTLSAKQEGRNRVRG